MIYPTPLQSGDEVAIIATSGPCNPTRLALGVQTLENLGLKCHIYQSCYAQEGFLAGEDELRLNDLHEAFSAPNIRGIFVARGGYGSQRLLPFINCEIIKNNPKIFAGYSDVTALHTLFNQQCQLVTFHAPMPAVDFGSQTINPQTLEGFTSVILSPLPITPAQFNLSASILTHHQLHAPIAAPLTGGNLTLIASSLGTPFEINTTHKILFLEEVNEEPYKVDRLLLQLKLARKLDNVVAIVLGDFTPFTIDDYAQSLRDILFPLHIPIFSSFACGHGEPNYTIPLGATITLNSLPTSPNKALPPTAPLLD